MKKRVLTSTEILGQAQNDNRHYTTMRHAELDSFHNRHAELDSASQHLTNIN